MRHPAIGILTIFAMLMGIGCSSEQPNTYPVSGTVLFNKIPVEGAGVMFQPVEGGSYGFGVTDQNGSFVISTFEIGDGAIPGEHRVTVKMQTETGLIGSPTDGLASDDTTQESPTLTRPMVELPSRYGKADTSGLTVIVESSMDPINLELTTY